MEKKYTKKELLLKTADALESGKFQQARNDWGGGNLGPTGYIASGFCCLHVMAAIASGTEDQSMSVKDRIVIAEPATPLYNADPDKFVTEYCGLTDMQRDTFILMNDETNRTFPQIAVTMRGIAKKLKA